MRQYHGPGPSGVFDTTRYTYTPAGQLASVADPAGNMWRFGYDQRGRKISAHDPDAGDSTFGYNDLDQLTTSTDSRGSTLVSTYDQLGRKTALYNGSVSTATKLALWEYDTKLKGQLYYSARFVNGQQYIVATMAMDELYRPTQTQYAIPADAGTQLAGIYTFNTSYNADGTVRSVSSLDNGDAPGEVVTYSYDDLQQVTDIVGGSNRYAGGFRYSQTGDLLQVELNTGGKASWVNNFYEEGTGRLTRSTLNRKSTTEVPRPGSDLDQAYTYDPAGNVLSIADTPSSGVRDIQCFTYDHLRRMTGAWSTANLAEQPCAGGPATSGVGGPAPYQESYTLDQVGNRLSDTVQVSGVTAGIVEHTYTYPAAGQDRPHALATVTEKTGTGDRLSTFAYDAAGNTTRRSHTGQDQNLTWDPEGHLASSTENGQTTSFVYTADGDRLVRREPGATTVYLPGMELRLDTTTRLVATTHLIAVTDTVTAMRTVAGIQFQVADHHGTGQAAIDATTGELVQRRSTPYGTPRGIQPTSAQWVGDKGFVGGTQDTTTGLTHLGAREYDPGTGRFTSVDPVLTVTDPQQLNAYAYSNNNPVSYTDPAGTTYSCGCNLDDDRGHPEDPGAAEAAEAAEPIEVTWAREDTERNKQILTAAAVALGKILMDELGITDALDCFTSGNLGACASTALTVVSSLVGGIAGKLLARYGTKLKKLWKLVNRVKELGQKLVHAVSGWIESSKNLKRAKNLATKLAGNCTDTFNSFTPTTRVLLADGTTKPIDQITVGDTVTTTNPETGETTPQTVVATIVGEGDKHLVQITINTHPTTPPPPDTTPTPETRETPGGNPAPANTPSSTTPTIGTTTQTGDDTTDTIPTGDGILIATGNHPFWVANLHQWTNATNLQPGQWLRTSTGTWVQITALKHWTQPARVHNLTTTTTHTYYVIAGTVPVLVHNAGGSCDVRFVVDSEGVATDTLGPQSDIEINKLAGDGYRNDVAAYLREHGRMVVTDADNPTALTFRTPYGPRRFDIGVWDADGNLVSYIETKWGQKRYGGLQRKKDDWLRGAYGFPIHIQQSHV